MSVDAPVVKATTAMVASFGLASWSDLAAFLAAVYSLLLIVEWVWKKFLRACLERRGWLKPRRRRATDYRE